MTEVMTAQRKLKFLTDNCEQVVELHPKDGSFLIHYDKFVLQVHPDSIHIGIVTGELLKYGPKEIL